MAMLAFENHRGKKLFYLMDNSSFLKIIKYHLWIK